MSKNEITITKELAARAIPVRKLLKLTVKTLIRNIKGGLIILFEDGVIKHLKSKEIVLSSFYWEIFKYYPNLPIKSNYVATLYFKNGVASNDSHLAFLEVISEDIIYNHIAHSDNKGAETSKLHSLIHDLAENIYDAADDDLKAYLASIDVIDMLEIQLRPKNMEAINNVKDKLDSDSVKNSYRVFDKEMESPELRNNPVVLASKSGAVNNGQLKAMLNVGGYKTDANGKIFPYPVASSFMLGMENMYDIIVESRTAVKALYLSTVAIQSTETFAKELQLLAMYIEKIYRNDDCGSTNYLEWIVSDAKDLKNILGSYYLNSETNKLELITTNSQHLIGKQIKLRNSIGCKHWNKHAVCGKCFGDLHYQIPETANIGHYSGVSITEPTTSLSLKSKHQNDSASADEISLDDVSEKFLMIKNKSVFAIKDGYKAPAGVKVIIRAPQEFLYGIKDINEDNVNTIDIFKVTRVKYFDIIVSNEKGNEELYRIDVQRGNRIGALTDRFLQYILKNGYTLSKKTSDFEIDITNIKAGYPVVILPDIEYNYLSLALDIKSMLKKVTLKDNSSTFLAKLYTLINSKLSINIAFISIIVRALLVADIKNQNFDLPGEDVANSQVYKILDVTKRRSLSNSLVLGWAASTLKSAHSFTQHGRPNSVLDVLFTPEQAIYHYRKRKEKLALRENEMKEVK